MKAFIKLDTYYNLINPAQGAILISFDSNNKKLIVYQKNNKLAEFSQKNSSGCIPTKLSEFQNDTHFITIDDIDIDNFNIDTLKSQLKTYIDQKLVKVFTYKGKKNSVLELPTNASIGDVYVIQSKQYVYDGSNWEQLGPLIDLSNYVTVQQLNSKADISNSLSGYGIEDAYTKEEINNKNYYNNIYNFMKVIKNSDELESSISGYLYCVLEEEDNR